LGYFWPVQAGCSAPSPTTAQQSSFPLTSGLKNVTACPSSPPPPSNPYSMSITIGLYNPCIGGCEASSLRTCLQTLSTCYLDVGNDPAGLCNCVNSALPLCAQIAQNCNYDPFAMQAMNAYYIDAVSKCAVANLPITLYQSTTPTTCTDCTPATVFAVIFALLFGGVFAYYVWHRYHTKAAAPLQNMRQEAINRARL